MASNHTEKYLTKLLIGFSCIIAAVMIIFYACYERRKDDWYYWGLISSVLFCIGVFCMTNAFVHKVKSDFSRKQRIRHQQKAGDIEEQNV